MKMRDKLRRAYQKDQSVHEYVHELESIQKGLWREKLTPTTCSWDLLVETAVFLEMAEKVETGPRKPPKGGGHNAESSSQPRAGGSGKDSSSAPPQDKGDPSGRGANPISGTTRKAPQLSDKERAALIADGKCFEEKHLAFPRIAYSPPILGRSTLCTTSALILGIPRLTT
ncbi:hypothetical protein B0H21DRAFT_766956 [Amylocystis lapponica]|nr:hypothetical protein B0H21DRAFT_766956 [Amylocystis lapponica]